MFTEIDKYIVSFFFDSKSLELILVNKFNFFFKFSYIKDQYETQKNSNFNLTTRFRKPPA